jgi:hypothetical protein
MCSQTFENFKHTLWLLRRVFLGNVTFIQQVKKFFAFHATLKLISVFRKNSQRTPPWIKWMQSTLANPSLRTTNFIVYVDLATFIFLFKIIRRNNFTHLLFLHIPTATFSLILSHRVKINLKITKLATIIFPNLPFSLCSTQTLS